MKSIIASTALALMLSTAAFAETTTTTGLKTYEQQAGASNFYASELIGMRVYSAENEYDTFDADTRVAEGAEAEWDDIGEVNDVIIGRDGTVQAVILGVGGFIGLGEKDVALPMDSIKMVQEQDDADDFFLVVNASKDALTAAAEYERMEDVSESAETERDDSVTTAGMTGSADEDTRTIAESADGDTMESAEVEAEEPKTMATTDMNTAEGADEQFEETAEAGEADSTSGTLIASNDDAETMETTRIVEAENDDVASPATERAMLRQPNVDREGYVIMTAADITPDKLQGARVFGINDEDIGEIDELLMDASGKFNGAVLDIGGFLGIGEHEVAVTPQEIKFMATEDGSDFRAYVDATKEELEAQPEYND